MRRRLFAAVVVLSAVVPACSRPSTDAIQVGHVAPFSGEFAWVGQHQERGIRLAVEEANRDDALIQGRRVVVRHVDDRNDPEVAGADAVRLATLNRVVALLGGSDVENATQIEQAARPYTVPLLSFTSLALPDREDAPFSLALTAALQGKALGGFVKDVLKPSRVLVAVADESHGQGREIADAFLLESKGSSITIDRTTHKNSADPAELRKEITAFGPDAVLLVGSSPEFVKKLRDDRKEKVTSWLYAGDDVRRSALQQNGAASRNLYFASAYVVDTGTDQGKEFARKYREQFKDEPDIEAALGYESARFLFESMRKSNGVTPSRLRDTLAEEDHFEGLTGTVALDKGHLVNRPVFIVQMSEQGLKVVKRP